MDRNKRPKRKRIATTRGLVRSLAKYAQDESHNYFEFRFEQLESNTTCQSDNEPQDKKPNMTRSKKKRRRLEVKIRRKTTVEKTETVRENLDRKTIDPPSNCRLNTHKLEPTQFGHYLSNAVQAGPHEQIINYSIIKEMLANESVPERLAQFGFGEPISVSGPLEDKCGGIATHPGFGCNTGNDLDFSLDNAGIEPDHAPNEDRDGNHVSCPALVLSDSLAAIDQCKENSTSDDLPRHFNPNILNDSSLG